MRQQLVSLALLVVLTACGGGGGPTASDTATSPAAVLQVLAAPSAIESSTTASPVAAKAVDLTDAIAILKMIVGLDVNAGGAPLTAYQAYAADVDGNGRVELSDAISVLKRIVGLETATANWMFFNGTPTVADKLNPGLPPSVSAAIGSSTNVNMTAVLRGDVVSSSAFTYKWDLTSVPAGSTATLASATAASPSFKADVAGSYVATMTITDGSSNVATSSVTLTACNASNSSSPFSGCTSTGGDVSNASATVSGVASAGAPISGAYINVLSANGKYYSPSATTGADGTFQFTLNTSTYPTPLLVQISKTAGQSIGTYYSYVSGSDLSGLVITPLSNAVLGLATNSNLDQIFSSAEIPASLSNTSINAALQQVAKATSNQLVSLNVSDSALLLKNTSYKANGTGQDAILDAVSVGTANTNNGSVLVSSKLTGVSVQLDNGATSASISSIPFSSNSANLLVSLIGKINDVNLCFKNAINTNSSSASCMDVNFYDAGSNASTFISNIRSYIGTITSIGNASISWCTLDTPGLTLDSPASNLSGQTGICHSTFEVTTPAIKFKASNQYKFKLTSASSGISASNQYKSALAIASPGISVLDVKMYGNQLRDSLEIKPRIWVKSRVDSFPNNNTGITSGYAFNIGTALQQTSGNPLVTATSNLSAKVEILDSSGSNISTFYMQCVQGANCIDGNLTICKSASPTCAQSLDTTANMVLSVSSSLSQSIIEAKRLGFVSAKITAYNKILSDTTKSTNYTKTIPIEGIPIAQNIADSLTYPALTTASQAALAAWSGASTLSLNFNRGSKNINLYGINFGSQPSADVADSNLTLTGTATAANFTGINSRNGSTIIPLTSGCSNVTTSSASIANWRAIYFSGSFNNIDLIVKVFGSCYSSNY